MIEDIDYFLVRMIVKRTFIDSLTQIALPPFLVQQTDVRVDVRTTGATSHNG